MSEATTQLFLSGRPWDATYRTAEGQVVYKSKLAMPEKRDIKISRIIPSIVDSRPLAGVPTNSSGKENSFGHLARIECHMRRAVRIRMGDLDVATSEYLKPDKSGFWASLNNCVFTGPDGREYVWSLGNSTKLFLKDSEKTPVARYHHRKLGLIGEARPAMLDIRGREGYVRYHCRYLYLYGNTACGQTGYGIGRVPRENGIAWCTIKG